MCELAPFQCSALAAWAACSLDLGVGAWAGGQFRVCQAWRFTEHMATIYGPCVVFLRLSLFLVGWAVGGVWLGGWVGGAAGNRKHLSSGLCTSHENFIRLRRCIFDAYA